MSWANLFRDYKGKWVSLKDNHTTVIASGRTLSSVLKKSNKLGFENPFVVRVPKDLNAIVGGGRLR